MAKNSTSGNLVVFLDFDNTITLYDVFDDMLERFADDDGWVALEKDWKSGKIGSRECLAGQIKFIRAGKKALDRYLASVKIDPYFKKLLVLLEEKKIKTFILSDNFDYVLKGVLGSNGIEPPDIYSNRLKLSADRLIPKFPFTNKQCPSCAHCKTNNLLAKTNKGDTIVYIGDGRSDTCPSEHADIVFAKEHLEDHCRKKKLNYIPFNGLKDVYSYFKDV